MYNELSIVTKFCSLATLKGSSRIKKCDGRLFYEFCVKFLLKMSTIAQALSIAGTRSSGASVRTQNGKISRILTLIHMRFCTPVDHMHRDLWLHFRKYLETKMKMRQKLYIKCILAIKTCISAEVNVLLVILCWTKITYALLSGRQWKFWWCWNDSQ